MSQNWEDRGLTHILCFTKIRAHLGSGFRPGLPTSTLCTSPLSLSACVPRAIPAAFCLGLALRLPLRPPGLTPAEAQSLRLSAALAAALGCVPHGQWALLDADMLVMIDRSARLVELALVGRAFFALSGACASIHAGTSSAASGGCLRISPSRSLVEGLVLFRVAHPELLLLSPFRSGCSPRPGPRSCAPHHFATLFSGRARFAHGSRATMSRLWRLVCKMLCCSCFATSCSVFWNWFSSLDVESEESRPAWSSIDLFLNDRILWTEHPYTRFFLAHL